MAVKRLFNTREQFFDSNGEPLVGGQLFLYLANSSTRATSYNSTAGTTPNTNPLVTDAAGRLQAEVWVTTGASYKAVLANSGDGGAVLDPSSPIWTEDFLAGINDSTTVLDEWVGGPVATFVSAATFTLAGDQTSTFTKSRRLKVVDAGGTKYGTITDSSFAVGVTTVTVAVDGGGSLASPIAGVSYGLVDPANSSVSSDAVNKKGAAVASAATTNIWAKSGNEVHVTGSTGPITSLGTALYAGNARWVIFDSTPTVTAGANLQIQGVASGSSVTVAANDRWLVIADTTTSMLVTRFPASGVAPVALLPQDYINGFKLTTASTTTYDIAAGQAADSTNAAAINGGALTAKSQSAWAVGSSAGAKLSAAAMANNTWYYWYALLKDTDNTVDYGFDVATTPTLPSGYSKFRYIGARKTASGSTNWETFNQHGDEVLWGTPPALEVNGALSTANRTLTTVNIPPVRVKWFGNASQTTPGGAAGAAFIATDPLCADVAPDTLATPLASLGSNLGAAGASNTGGQVTCWANASSQIGLRGATASAVRIATLGWIDPRGKPV